MITWIAHRGDHTHGFVENSKEALWDALLQPTIDGVELDVRLTKDSNIVIHHDVTLERTSNGIGFVRDKTLKELKQLWFGSGSKKTRIATLEEFLSGVGNNKIILIELKDETGNYQILVDKLYTIYQKYRHLNLYFASFRNEVLEALQKKDANLKLGIYVGLLINHKYLKNNYSSQLITPELLKERNLKKETFVWTVREIDTLKRILEYTKKRPIAVITDEPLKLQQLLS